MKLEGEVKGILKGKGTWIYAGAWVQCPFPLLGFDDIKLHSI